MSSSPPTLVSYLVFMHHWGSPGICDSPLFGHCRYILFDGDVDALWVENMNSVMDDNKLLTLANGERIRLQAHCALLFEASAAENQTRTGALLLVTEVFIRVDDAENTDADEHHTLIFNMTFICLCGLRFVCGRRQLVGVGSLVQCVGPGD